MFKKCMALVLSLIMIFGSVVGVSAKENVVTPQTATRESIRGNDIKHFSMALPDQEFFNIVSVTASQRYYSAHRESNGDVILTINEIFNTTACYYRFYATDKTGSKFVPSNDLEFYIEKAGVHTVRFPASSVSTDGYINIYFAMNPGKDSTILDETRYSIPVDYEEREVVNDDHLTIEPNQNYKLTGKNGQYIQFNATATKMSNDNIIVKFNTISSNSEIIPDIIHKATDYGSFVFLPHSNSYFTAEPGIVNISLYKDNVSNGSVYFDIYLTYDGTRYLVSQIRIPVN